MGGLDVEERRGEVEDGRYDTAKNQSNDVRVASYDEQ